MCVYNVPSVMMALQNKFFICTAPSKICDVIMVGGEEWSLFLLAMSFTALMFLEHLKLPTATWGRFQNWILGVNFAGRNTNKISLQYSCSWLCWWSTLKCSTSLGKRPRAKEWESEVEQRECNPAAEQKEQKHLHSVCKGRHEPEQDWMCLYYDIQYSVWISIIWIGLMPIAGVW